MERTEGTRCSNEVKWFVGIFGDVGHRPGEKPGQVMGREQDPLRLSSDSSKPELVVQYEAAERSIAGGCSRSWPESHQPHRREVTAVFDRP